MKDSIILFLFLIPAFLFAQYPTTGNKSRLGWQTTGDGLIWRGVAGDTVNKPNNRNYPYFQLDTVNAVLYRYIATQGNWQAVGGGSIDIDSLIYATRFWVNSNFFPLQGGLLTGTAGNGFVGFPLQSSPPATPSTGFSLFAGSTGNNISWMQPDGFFRRLVSPVTGTPRQYQFMARSYTLADSADVAALPTGTGTTNYYAKWSSTNALTIGNLFDNNTVVSILNSKPFSLGQWTTAGRPGSVDGYKGRNTTTGFEEGYFTSQWENYITSTGASANQVPYYLSAGKIAGSSLFTWDNSIGGLSISSSSTSSSLRGLNIIQTNNGIQGATINFTKNRSGSAVQSGDIVGGFGFRGYSGSTYIIDNALFGALITGSVSSGSVPTSIFFNAGSTANNYNTQLLLHSGGNVGIGNFGSIISSITAPARKLHVIGEARITDLTTDTPTQIVGADADGDLGTMAISGGLSISSGTLSSTWLKPALEVGNVSIATNTNTLTLNGSSFTMQNQGGFNRFWIKGDTDYEGTIQQGQKTFTYFTQLDRGNPLLPGQYRLKHQIAQTSLGVGDHVINVTSVDTTSGLVQNFQGSFFGSEDFTQQFSVSSDASGVSGFKILKNDSGTTGKLFEIQSTTGTAFSNSVRADGVVTWSGYGALTKTATALSKTFSTLAGFATDGTVLNVEQKRDTTIYVTDADYNFSAAITSANILKRYNNIIIYSKLSASSTSDNQIFLHTPSSDFLQCNIIIYSNDASADSDATSVDFTSNGAVDGAGGTLSSYAMAPGQRVEIRVADDGGYKWFFN